MSTGPASADVPARAVDAALDRLAGELVALDRVVVAFSGGVDSALVAHQAHAVLGADALAVTAVSPSLAAAERAGCAELAAAWGLAWEEAATDELADPRYQANAGDRCYWCKSALMDVLVPVAAARRATIVLGVNLDDLDDHRPGQDAAAGRGAVFPLVDAGFDKALVRAAARRLGLEVWDKPAAPCLASRLPYGTEVTRDALAQVERAEAAVRALGIADLRVRHYGARARVELPLDVLGGLEPQAQAEVVDAVRSAGFAEVDLDPAGLRSGNLNLALR